MHRLIIDGINLDASHFGKMSEEDAIKNMEKDGIDVPGKDDNEKTAWRKEAYAKMKEHVEKENKKLAKDDSKEIKTVTKEMQNAQKAEDKAGVAK